MADLTGERAAELRKRIEALYPDVRAGIEAADRVLASTPAWMAGKSHVDLTFTLPPEMARAVSIALCIAVGMTEEGEEARDEIYLRGWKLLNGAK